MTDHNPSARVQVRERSQLVAPATCAVCGTSGHDRKYIDPDVNFEWEGAVYFCELCALEIAAALQCLPPEESEFLVDQNKHLAEANASLMEKLDAARTELDNYHRLINAAVNGGYPLPSSSEGTPELEQESEPTADEPVTSGAEPEPESPEPVKVGGPNDTKRTSKRDRPTGFVL